MSTILPAWVCVEWKAALYKWDTSGRFTMTTALVFDSLMAQNGVLGILLTGWRCSV